jgi:hypothetical protein
MQRFAGRSVVVIVALVLGGAAAGLARASVDEIKGALLQPSALPAILGPITDLGRNGWDCAPERAAQAKSAGHAELPSDPGR